MANNKDFRTENGLQIEGAANIEGSLTASGIAYPTVDGAANQYLKTNGAGTLSLATPTTDELTEGATNQFYTDARATANFNTNLAASDTDDLSEGTNNKYYTDARVQGLLASYTGHIIPSADILYDLGSTTYRWRDVYVGPGSLYINNKQVLTDDSDTITFKTDLDQDLRIQTAGIGSIELFPSGTGQLQVKGTLQLDTGERITDSAGINVEFGDAINMNANRIVNVGAPSANTDAATKLYVDTSISGATLNTLSNVSDTGIQDGQVLEYDVTTSQYIPVTPYGSSNFNTDFASKSTTNLAEGTNLYYTAARDTANFNTNFTSKSTTDLSEGTNQYFTTARARGALSATGDLTYNSTTGAFGFALANHDTDDLAEGLLNLYYTDARAQAAISAGTGVTKTGGTLSIGQDVGTTANTTFATVTTTGNVDVGGNLTVDGNLTVTGTTTTINATELAIADNLIYLNDGSTTTNPDLGWVGNYNDGTYAHAGVFRDATDGTFKFFEGLTVEPGSEINTGHASFALADLQVANLIGNVTGNVTGNVSGSAGSTTGNAATASALQTARTIALSGDVSGSATFDGTANITITATVADDSHNHTIANVDGLQAALDGKLASSSYTAADVLTKIKTVDGSGSGLDADLLDGQSGAYYVDWTNTTNKPDPTITLAGDASGSLTMTDLAGGTLTVTVADNSHNHTASNISDFAEAVQDQIGGFVAGAGSVSVSYNDTTGVTTITGTDTNTTYSAGSGISLSGTTFSVAAGNGLTQEASGLAMSGSYTGTFTASGDVCAYSDARLKSEVETLSGALATVQALRGTSYIKDGKASIGVIAQEVEQVLPEVVHTADDEMGTKGVAYGNMVAVLIEAIKEQQEQIEELKAQVAELKG